MVPVSSDRARDDGTKTEATHSLPSLAQNAILGSVARGARTLDSCTRRSPLPSTGGASAEGVSTSETLSALQTRVTVA